MVRRGGGVPDGPTIKRMQEFAKKYAMVIVAPIYEEAMTGVYYNTAAVIDADGSYLGKYRQDTYPAGRRVLGEVPSSSRVRQLPGFSRPATASSASTSAMIAISPKVGARLALNGAEYIVNPSATVAGLSEYLWKLEQPRRRSPTASISGRLIAWH